MEIRTVLYWNNLFPQMDLDIDQAATAEAYEALVEEEINRLYPDAYVTCVWDWYTLGVKHGVMYKSDDDATWQDDGEVVNNISAIFDDLYSATRMPEWVVTKNPS